MVSRRTTEDGEANMHSGGVAVAWEVGRGSSINSPIRACITTGVTRARLWVRTVRAHFPGGVDFSARGHFLAAECLPCLAAWRGSRRWTCSILKPTPTRMAS
jgi:hypothetical protein